MYIVILKVDVSIGLWTIQLFS